MIGFLNYFLIPLISAGIYTRRRGTPANPPVGWLVRYAVFAVLDYMVTDVGITAVRFLLHREIFRDSVRYTIAAVCVACVLPFVWEILHTAFSHVEFHVEPRKR